MQYNLFCFLFFYSLLTSLIQAQLGCISIQEFGLAQDTGKIFRSGIRLSKCNLSLLRLQCVCVFNNYPNNVLLIASVCQCQIDWPLWVFLKPGVLCALYQAWWSFSLSTPRRISQPSSMLWFWPNASEPSCGKIHHTSLNNWTGLVS